MGRGKHKIIVRKRLCEPDKESSCSCDSSNPGTCDSCKNKCQSESSSNTIQCSNTSSSSSCSSISGSNSQRKILIVEAQSSSSCSKSSSGCGGCGKCAKCKKVCYRRDCERDCVGGRCEVGGRNDRGGDGGGNMCKMGIGCSGSAFYDFCALVRPVKNFSILEGKSCGELKVTVSIVCRSVTIQWPSFTGQVDSSGVAYLSVNQSFRGLPKTNVFGSYLVNFKGANALSVIEVLGNNDNTIRWYLTANQKSNNVSNGDAFTIYAGAINFLMAKDCCD